MWSIKVQDLYKVLVTESGGIAASGDVNFTLSSAPRYTNGFLVIEPDSTTNRETVYFHNVVGNRVYVRWVNRKNPKFHAVSATVQMNDVEEIFNFYADMASPLFYVEKTGGLTIRVWGGTVLINRTQVTIADTALTLTDNATNYVVYDYLTNIVSVNTTGTGLVKATIVVLSGVITSITYNVIKESYADPYVPDTSLVAPVIQNNAFAYAVSTGSANAYLVSYTPAVTAYAAGQKFFFKANFQNTGAATINVNGLWAKTIKKLDWATDLVATDIASGAMVEVMYDGTNFQLTSIPQTIKNNDVTQLTSVNLLTAKTKPHPNDFLLLSDSESGFVNKKVILSAINNTYRLFTAWENISAGDPLYMNTSWVVFKTVNDTSFIWFANTTASSWQQVQVAMLWVVWWLSWLTIWSSYFVKIPNNSWTTKTSITTSREYPCWSVVNNKIYVIWWYNSTQLSTNEEYDPSLNTWTTKTSMTTARHSLVSGVVNNKIYVIWWNNGTTSSANEEYDPSLNTWATKTAMSIPKYGAASWVVNNKIYVIAWRDWPLSPSVIEYDAGPFWVISTVSSSMKVWLALSATELLIKPNL